MRRWIDEGAPWPHERTSFNRDVRPILAGSYACHGPDRNQRQAGLRLDREEAAKGRLPSGRFAIVPYEPEKSALIERIIHPDENVRMPLASSGKPRLSATEIKTLRDWISGGAPWESHWSFISPERPPVPSTKRSDWAKNEVDAFVLAAIEKTGASPSPEAKRFELLRRLSFDLTGLPPTPEEIRTFEEERKLRCLREAGRSTSRFAGLRREDGHLLARSRALRGQRRLSQRQRSKRVAVPGFGRLRLESKPPLRPLHDRAARERPPSRRGART